MISWAQLKVSKMADISRYSRKFSNQNGDPSISATQRFVFVLALSAGESLLNLLHRGEHKRAGEFDVRRRLWASANIGVPIPITPGTEAAIYRRAKVTARISRGNEQPPGESRNNSSSLFTRQNIGKISNLRVRGRSTGANIWIYRVILRVTITRWMSRWWRRRSEPRYHRVPLTRRFGFRWLRS